MKHFKLILFILMITPLFAVANDKGSKHRHVQWIVHEELKFQEQIRILEKELKIAQMKARIRKLNGQSDLDIGMGSIGSSASIQMPLNTSSGHHSHDHETKKIPIIMGFRDGKGLFKQDSQIFEFGKNQTIPGGYKVLSVDANGATLKLPNGKKIQQKISWRASKKESEHAHE